MTNIINGILPLVMIAYFFHFRRERNLNNLLLIMVFLSYFAFATNYEKYGLDFDLYRYLHKFIGVLAIVGLAHHVFKNNLAILNNSVFYLLLTFLLAIGASYFNNDLHISHYLHYARNFFFLSLLVLFIYLKLDTNQKVDELLHFSTGLILILAVAAIIEVYGSWGNRVTLFYSNTNYLAIALMFGFSTLLFVETKFRIVKLGVVALAIFFTQSDAALVGVIILLLLYLFKKTALFSPNLFFTGLAVLIISSGILFHQKIVEIYHGEVRVALAKTALNGYNDNPINGIGYGQFRTQYHKYVDGEILKNLELHTAVLSHDASLTDEFIRSKGMARNMEKMTHNDLMKIIVELGSIGLGFLLFYFYKLYFELKKLFDSNQEYFYISLSLLVGSLIFSLFHNNITSFVFWFVLFLPFIINRNYLKKDLSQ